MDNVFVFIVLIAFMSFSQFLGIVLYVRFERLCKKLKTMLYTAVQKQTAEEQHKIENVKSDYEMDDI